jgi:hypothetical protein
VFEFCSGLIDLVVGVARHGGGGHRLIVAGERFVGRLAEDIAVVISGTPAWFWGHDEPSNVRRKGMARKRWRG